MSATFTYRRPVRFRDTDMAGVVHFTAALAMVEEAWHAWLGAAGLAVHPSAVPVGEEPAGWPLVSVACDFRAPLRFGDTADVALVVERAGRSSLRLRFRIEVPAGPAAEGQYTVACARPGADGAWRARPLPDRIEDRLAEASGEVA